MMLGRERTRWGVVRRGEHRKIVAETLALLDHPDFRRPTCRRGGSASGALQLVEVARALVSDARVIVFDEPTSSLTEKRFGQAIRGHRSPAVARAGDRLHQPFPGRSEARGATIHGVAGRPVGGDRLDRREHSGGADPADGGPGSDGNVPQRGAIGRGGDPGFDGRGGPSVAQAGRPGVAARGSPRNRRAGRCRKDRVAASGLRAGPRSIGFDPRPTR